MPGVLPLVHHNHEPSSLPEKVASGEMLRNQGPVLVRFLHRGGGGRVQRCAGEAPHIYTAAMQNMRMPQGPDGVCVAQHVTENVHLCA